MQAVLAAMAALAGILIGYWLRSAAAAREKQQLEARLAEGGGEPGDGARRAGAGTGGGRGAGRI